MRCGAVQVLLRSDASGWVWLERSLGLGRETDVTRRGSRIFHFISGARGKEHCKLYPRCVCLLWADGAWFLARFASGAAARGASNLVHPEPYRLIKSQMPLPAPRPLESPPQSKLLVPPASAPININNISSKVASPSLHPLLPRLVRVLVRLSASAEGEGGGGVSK